jgi:hypothetical protein
MVGPLKGTHFLFDIAYAHDDAEEQYANIDSEDNPLQGPSSQKNGLNKITEIQPKIDMIQSIKHLFFSYDFCFIEIYK